MFTLLFTLWGVESTCNYGRSQVACNGELAMNWPDLSTKRTWYLVHLSNSIITDPDKICSKFPETLETLILINVQPRIQLCNNTVYCHTTIHELVGCDDFFSIRTSKATFCKSNQQKCFLEISSEVVTSQKTVILTSTEQPKPSQQQQRQPRSSALFLTSTEQSSFAAIQETTTSITPSSEL